MRPSEAGARAKSQTIVPWDDLRAARVQRRVLEAMRTSERAASGRPARWLALVAAALLVAVGIGGVIFFLRGTPQPQGPNEGAGIIELPDGSTVVVQPATDSTVAGRVVPRHVSAERIEMDQLGGAASYEVAKGHNRVFIVHAGDVRVEVLGTSFRVERLESAVRVVVLEGRVKVTRSDQTAILVGGDDITFGAGDTSVSAPPVPVAPAPKAAAAAPQLRETAGASGAPSVASSPQASAAQLFRQADDARGRGDHGEALRLLRRLVAEFPRDSRAVLATFTIGRLELQRGEPALAARAFESCGGAMKGEAMAEAALAWSRAGNAGRASEIAKAYLAAHPDGPRRVEMEALGR